jgi:protein-disulfide isomerase
MSKIWVGLAVLLVAAVGSAWWYTSERPIPAAAVSTPATPAPAATAASPTASTPDATTAASDDRILGKPDAPITIIEFASLTCPHCAAFEAETLPRIKQEWIDTGKAKLIFRDFPLDGLALKGAILARCAPPERFYGFIDVLFRQQDVWARAADPQAALGRIAKLGGMSEDQFQACMKDDAAQNKILAMRMAGEKDYKVESTPTFFINGKKLVGALPYESFAEALKAAGKT